MLIYRSLLLFLLCVYSLSVFCQNADSTHEHKDSATIEMDRLYGMGAKVYGKDKDSAAVVFNQLLSIAEREKNWDYYVRSLNVLAAIHYSKSDYKQYEYYALKSYNSALEHLGENTSAFSVTLNNLNTLYFGEGTIIKV